MQELASCGVPVLRKAVGECSETLAFDKVSLSGEPAAENSLVLLDGWIPAANIDAVAPALEDLPVFFDVSDPTTGDNIPILLNNVFS